MDVWFVLRLVRGLKKYEPLILVYVIIPIIIGIIIFMFGIKQIRIETPHTTSSSRDSWDTLLKLIKFFNIYL